MSGAVPNPDIEGTIGTGRARDTGASRLEWSLSLTVPLDWMARRRAGIHTAEAEVDVSIAEAEVLRRDVLLTLETLFWRLAGDQAAVAALEALEAQMSALVETVQKRVDNGEVRPVEAIRAEIEFEKVAGELESARTALLARRDELALWIGVPPGKTLMPVADLNSLPLPPGRDEALSMARRSHPSLDSARARTRSLEAEVGVEKRARVPAFGLTGFTSHELDRRAWGVGLAADLPLWNWNSGRIARAEALLAASHQQTVAADLALQASVLDIRAACEASVATATRFRNNVVPRSEAAASTMEKTYRLGEASLLEVIDARRTLLDSRRLYLNALSQAQIDCSRLRALIGKEPG